MGPVRSTSAASRVIYVTLLMIAPTPMAMIAAIIRMAAIVAQNGPKQEAAPTTAVVMAKTIVVTASATLEALCTAMRSAAFMLGTGMSAATVMPSSMLAPAMILRDGPRGR